MGLETAARKNDTKNVRSPNDRRRRMVPHVGATELGAGWLRMRTVREDTAHGASVDQELLLAVVIL
jgi:hypothetical protein